MAGEDVARVPEGATLAPPLLEEPPTNSEETGHQTGGSRSAQPTVTLSSLIVRVRNRANEDPHRQPESKTQPDPAQSQDKLEDPGVRPLGDEAGPAEADNTTTKVTGRPYRLDILLPVPPGRSPPGQSHSVDIVAVHDYDETSVNWAYKDREAILRQKIDDIRAEKSRLPETADKTTATEGRIERGRQPSLAGPSKLGTEPTSNLAPPEQVLLRAASLQDVSKEAENVEKDGAGAAGLLVPETREAVSGRNTEVGSSRASSPTGHTFGVNWLQNTNMLPSAVPGVRVLGFSYPTHDLRKLLGESSDQSKQHDYVDRVASELLIELRNVRPSDLYNNIPIIFLASGFGGVIVQKALSSAGSRASLQGQGAKAGASRKKAAFKDPEHGKPEETATSISPRLELDQVADIIFMDTPFPKKESEGLNGFFPLTAASVRISGIHKMMKKMETEWDSPGVDKIWAEFWMSLREREQPTRVAWFYSSATGKMIQPAKKISPISKNTTPVITLNRIPLNRSGLRRLTNFRDSKDPSYILTISRIHESLMIAAVQNEKFKALQLSLMKAGAPVNVEDEWGMSLLHLAARAPNPDGVTMLLRNNADPQARDSERQTPLLLAIKLFCNSEPDTDSHVKSLKAVIVHLLSFTTKPELNNNTDERGRTVRAIVENRGHKCAGIGCRHEIVQNLLNKHRPYVRKRMGEDREEPWKNWNPPKEGSLQRKACEGAKGIIAEFYETSKDGPLSDYEVHSVLDLIYQKEGGPAKILSKWTETNISRHSQDVNCRWIHVPANNEQWIHDLFLRLQLKDSSMNDQRHKGYTVWNQYMIADAKRYKHNRFPPSIEVQNPKLGVIPEEPSTEGEDLSDESGFRAIMKSDGQGWLGLPPPKGLDGAADVIVLFMPVLAFEEHRPRKKMTRAIRKTLEALRTPELSLSRRSSTLNSSQASGSSSISDAEVDTSVIEAYLEHERPIHCRRTLDQYRYYMLEDTEARDLDQVVYKWARNQQHESKASAESGRADKKLLAARNRPVIMVDQLWLWILPDGTVISSLPNTADATEAYNLGYKLESALFDGIDAPAKSVDDLVTVILKNCVDFLKRDGPCGVKFHDCFQYTISRIAEDEARTYAEYKNAVTCLERLKKRRLLQTLSQKYTDTFSQITEETNRLVEIMDIQDELSIVESVLLSQKTVLQRLIHRMHQKKVKTQKADASIQAKEIALRDTSRIQEVIQIVEDNISSVKEMDTSAKKVQEDLKQLLDFKQQQSNAWEMHYSMRLSVQGQKQNNIMLVFTLVTIVFLPMSFMSSFFAINVEGFPLNPDSGEVAWPLGELCAYLFGISLALSIPLILAAFYVNDITRMTKRKKGEDPFSEGRVAGSSPPGHDSDEDSDAEAIKKKDRKHRNPRPNNPDSVEGGEYALLFGIFSFHTMVPLLRRLWKYYPYRLYQLEEVDEGLDDFDWDYPLSRFRKKFAEPINDLLLRIGLRKLGMAYWNHERNYMLDRTPDGLVKELLKEKIELRERERNARVWRERLEVDRRSDSSHSPGPLTKEGVWAGPPAESVRPLGSARSKADFGIRDAFGGRRRSRQGLGDGEEV